MTRVIQDSDDEAEALTPVTSPARQTIPQYPSSGSSSLPAPILIELTTVEFYQTRIAQFNENFAAGPRDISSSSEHDEEDRSTKRRKLSHAFESTARIDTDLHLEVQSPRIAPIGGHEIRLPKLPRVLNNVPPAFTGSDLISTVPDNTYQQMQIVAQSTELVDPFEFPPGPDGRVYSEFKSSSLPWTQIRAIEAADELPNDEPVESMNYDIGINFSADDPFYQQTDTHDTRPDVAPDELDGGPVDLPTFTPPGIPHDLFKKPPHKKAKTKRKAKKKKTSLIVEGLVISEDELAGNEPTVAKNNLADSLRTPTKRDQANMAEPPSLTISPPHTLSKVRVVIPISNSIIPELDTDNPATENYGTELVIASAHEVSMDLHDSTSPKLGPTPRKRGRGRPRKSKEIPLPSSVPLALDVCTDGVRADSETVELQKSESLTNQDGQNNNTDRDTVAAPQTAIKTTLAEEKENLVHINVDVKPAKVLSQLDALRSKGKVPYRVGLSRRVRITSLLRSVRK